MNNKLLYFLMFTAGIAVGSFSTYKYFKEKYEKKSQEEINSVKETFSKLNKKNIYNYNEKEESKIIDVDVAKKKAEEAREKPNMMEYAAMLNAQRYSEQKNKEEQKEIKIMKKKETHDGPYVIPPEEFGEMDDYSTISLTYYSDGFLADSRDELIDNINEIIGPDALNTFGEYEDDSVFVRNDERHCDYEILLDERQYSDVVN